MVLAKKEKSNSYHLQSMMMRWFLGCYHDDLYLYDVVIDAVMMIHLLHDQYQKPKMTKLVVIHLMMLLLKTIHGCE